MATSMPAEIGDGVALTSVPHPLVERGAHKRVDPMDDVCLDCGIDTMFGANWSAPCPPDIAGIVELDHLRLGEESA